MTNKTLYWFKNLYIGKLIIIIALYVMIQVRFEYKLVMLGIAGIDTGIDILNNRES